MPAGNVLSYITSLFYHGDITTIARWAKDICYVGTLAQKYQVEAIATIFKLQIVILEIYKETNISYFFLWSYQNIL